MCAELCGNFADLIGVSEFVAAGGVHPFVQIQHAENGMQVVRSGQRQAVGRM